MTIIAEVPTPDRIVFGTDGWRARVADDYTYENVRRCADGVAAYVAERGERRRGNGAAAGVEIHDEIMVGDDDVLGPRRARDPFGNRLGL